LRDFTKFWRKDDATLVEEELLDYPSDNIYEMPDINFRMGSYGQAEFTIDGVDYVAQFYPPNLENLEATPERMIAEMNVAGVDMGILQTDHVYGDTNEYFRDCSRKFPGRFIGLAQVREWEADQEREAARLKESVLEYGNRGLYFSVEPFALNHWTDHIDDARFEPLWSMARQLEIPVWWYLDARWQDRTAGFLQRIDELERWTDEHPDIPSVITHGIVPAAVIHDIGMPDKAVSLLKRPNTYAEILFQAKWPDYPFVECHDMFKHLRDEVGAESLMWGSDMPFSSGFWCTYRQAIDYIRVHCDFLSDGEKSMILGGNAARMFGID